MRLLPVAAFSALLLGAGSAAASEGAARPFRSFYVDTRAPECAASASALADAITLACESSHASCRASTAPGGADRRLVLDCAAAETWALDAFDASGTLEWTTDLAGSVDDRVREGAAAAVRTVIDDAPRVDTPLPLVVPDGPRTGADHVEPAGGGLDLPKVLVFGGFAVAAVSTTVGIVLAIDHANRNAPAPEPPVGRSCSDGPCVEPAAADSPARGPGTGAYVAFGIAGAGVVTGIVGLVLWPRSAPKATTPPSPEVTPVVGLGSFALRGTF